MISLVGSLFTLFVLYLCTALYCIVLLVCIFVLSSMMYSIRVLPSFLPSWHVLPFTSPPPLLLYLPYPPPPPVIITKHTQSSNNLKHTKRKRNVRKSVFLHFFPNQIKPVLNCFFSLIYNIKIQEGVPKNKDDLGTFNNLFWKNKRSFNPNKYAIN